MEDGKVWKLEPPKVNAAEDCNEAISDWRKHQQAAIKTGKMEAAVIDGKATLKDMDAAITDHGKLSAEVKETVTEVKSTLSDAETAITKVKDVIKSIDGDIEKAESLDDALAEKLLGQMKSKVKTISSNLTHVYDRVKEFNTELETTKDDLDDQLKQLKDHKNTAAADVKMAVDFKADIRQSHELSVKIRKLQVTAENHEAELKEFITEAEEKAENIKEEAIAMKTTTTTTNLNCQCYHCGGTETFNSADVCGEYTESGEYPCGPETSGSGCWTYAPQGCVCSSETIVQPCQCYHCGGMEEYNNADVCGAATTSGEYPCGPETSGSGCWNNVDGATCQCDTHQTTG
jgi:DNA repair exonuclease SbcCD ATPase subunit